MAQGPHGVSAVGSAPEILADMNGVVGTAVGVPERSNWHMALAGSMWPGGSTRDPLGPDRPGLSQVPRWGLWELCLSWTR